MIIELLEQKFSFDAVHLFKDEAAGLGSRIPNHVEQLDDVRAAIQCLENFDLAVDFLNLNRFKHLYYTLTVVVAAAAKEDFRVFAAAQLMIAFVISNIAPGDFKLSIIAILGWSLLANVRIFSGPI